MSDEHEKPADRIMPALEARERGLDAPQVNPYQSPTYHPDEAGPQKSDPRSTRLSPLFIGLAVSLLVLGLFGTIVTNGAGVPLLLGIVGGIIRASAMHERQKCTNGHGLPPEVLLFTSTLVTLLLMFCCTIAFGAICTGGVLATMGPGTEFSWIIWMAASGVAGLAAFIFMYVRSVRWGA